MTRVVGRLGALIGLLFFLSIIDLAVSGFLEPRGVFRAISGEAQLVSGNLSARIPSVEDLVFSSDSPLMKMEFLDANGTLWRGKLHVAPSVRDGEFRFKVSLKPEVADKKIPEYTLQVYPDRATYRASSHSLYERYLGIPPWWIAIAAFPLLLLSLAISYRFSARKEALLNKMGMATIFKVNRRKEGCEISFGIGLRDGVREGESLELLDALKQPMGKVRVKKAAEQYSTAEVDPSLRVKPNCLVAKYS